MPATPAAKARTKNVAAAKRLLKLIETEAARHGALLAEGQVPEGSFLASVIKYDQALSAAALLDSLNGEPAADGAVLADDVRLDDLAALVLLVQDITGTPPPGQDMPLTRLMASAFPDRLPAPVAATAATPAAAQNGA